MTLLQACLSETGRSPASAVSVSLEIAEITSKALDWRAPAAQSETQERAMAEFVTGKYLQFVELVATNLVGT